MFQYFFRKLFSYAEFGPFELHSFAFDQFNDYLSGSTLLIKGKSPSQAQFQLSHKTGPPSVDSSAGYHGKSFQNI